MTRTLFITHTPPWPTSNGGQQRSHLLYRALERLGEVDLVLMPWSITPHAPAVVERLRRDYRLVGFPWPQSRGRHGLWSVVRPIAPLYVDAAASLFGSPAIDYTPDESVASWLDDHVRDGHYDLVVGRYVQPTVRSGAIRLAPLILDVDDLDTERIRTELEHAAVPAWRRPLLRRRLRLLERGLEGWLRQADHLWVCSEADRRMLCAAPPKTARSGLAVSNRSTLPHRSCAGSDATAELPVSVLPNIPFPFGENARVEALPPSGETQRVLFVGSLNYKVNVRAVDRFVTAVWPIVHAKHPAAELRLVGGGVSLQRQSGWSRTAGVNVVGFVDNLSTEYRRAAFCIAPIFEGGGTKIKVLEALAFGRTCLVTRHAQRGFEHLLHHGESVYVADNDEQLAAGCCLLLQDAALRNAMAATGSRVVAQCFSFDHFASVVRETVERVLDGRGNGLRRKTRQP